MGLLPRHAPSQLGPQAVDKWVPQTGLFQGLLRAFPHP